MFDKKSEGSFDFNELKSKMNRLQEASEKAKKEYKEKSEKGEVTKQSLVQKIIGIIGLILIIICVGLVIWSNLDTIFLPKNSVTIVVTDQNGEAINGLKISLNGPEMYDETFENISDVTFLEVESGKYSLTFDEVPEGYDCLSLYDNFTLNKDAKIKLKYECKKE